MTTSKKKSKVKVRRKRTKDFTKCRFNMEVSGTDLDDFRKAASRAGLSMSSWGRIALRKAVG